MNPSRLSLDQLASHGIHAVLEFLTLHPDGGVAAQVFGHDVEGNTFILSSWSP